MPFGLVGGVAPFDGLFGSIALDETSQAPSLLRTVYTCGGFMGIEKLIKEAEVHGGK